MEQRSQLTVIWNDDGSVIDSSLLVWKDYEKSYHFFLSVQGITWTREEDPFSVDYPHFLSESQISPEWNVNDTKHFLVEPFSLFITAFTILTTRALFHYAFMDSQFKRCYVTLKVCFLPITKKFPSPSRIQAQLELFLS